MEVTTACDAWKRCTLEMVNIISNSSKPSLIKDYNYLLLENIDLKKQNKMTVAALDSALSEKDVDNLKNGEARNGTDDLREEVTVSKTVDKKKLNRMATATSDLKLHERGIGSLKNGEASNALLKEVKFCEMMDSVIEKRLQMMQLKSPVKRADPPPDKKSVSSLKAPPETTNETCKMITKDSQPSTSCSVQKITRVQDFVCTDCSKLQSSGNQLLSDLTHLKQKLDQANECNRKLTVELNAKAEENDHLRDQIQSLDLAVKTLTEAINLQDEQLSEYGSLVASLRKSRSQIIEKMKEANARNNYNVMIMGNIEQEVEKLRRQLDAYNDLLINQQNINLIDKASSTEQADIERDSNEELLKKKDNYIALLQDRLCEAIVDLKNKDSEIKNHANSVKELIYNYETEKKCLEDRIKNATVSNVKMEENRIKQQETMKQLMKLIEFLQGKLEKINKK